MERVSTVFVWLLVVIVGSIMLGFVLLILLSCRASAGESLEGISCPPQTICDDARRAEESVATMALFGFGSSDAKERQQRIDDSQNLHSLCRNPLVS